MIHLHREDFDKIYIEVFPEKYLKIHISKIFVRFNFEILIFINSLLVVISNVYFIKQEALKASNSPRDRKDGIQMAKKIVEGRQLFSNNDIFLGRYAFNWSDVERRSVLLQLNASIRLHQNLNKILHTVVYNKDLWHTTRDLMVKYTDQPKTGLVLAML